MYDMNEGYYQRIQIKIDKEQLELDKAKIKEYYNKNKKAIREQRLGYRQANRAVINTKKKIYYDANRDYYLAYFEKQRKENRTRWDKATY